MGDPEKEALCTVKGLLVFAVICIVYSSILFSLDPEWVAWAAPLAFGGALYTADPPPASAHLASPGNVFPAAYLCDVVSLFGIVLLTLVPDSRHLSWMRWFRAQSASRSIRKVRRFLRSSFTLIAGR